MESSYLTGKKILFISTGFYDYDQSIIHEMTEQGGDVEYLCSSGSSQVYRFLNKVGLIRIAQHFQVRLLMNKVKNLRTDNDIIFIIKGNNLNDELLDIIFGRNPFAKRILYLWDDVARVSNIEILMRRIPNIFSFDTEDCRQYGFKFRPLFYRNNTIDNKGKNEPCAKYYMSSISGLHSDRLFIFRSVAEILDSKGYSYILKLVTSKFDYLQKKFFFKIVKKTDDRIITTHTYPFNEVERIISNSKCVLDSPFPSQRGLTIRTIEALRAGCHLFTTNFAIKEYNDISLDYYTLIDKKNIDKEIFKNEYPISKLSERYSLRYFLFEILYAQQ